MKIRVQKYDPSSDAAPYFVEGEIEYREHMSALEALVDFHQSVQAANFDINCTSKWCGRCAMMLNGVPTLICVAPVKDAEYTFEPLAGFPVIRDLIVDKREFHDEISSISKRVRIEPFTAETIVPAEFDPSSIAPVLGMETCCRCGVCNAGCPALAAHPDDYVGPSGMTAIAYRHLDQLDSGDRVMEAVSRGMYHCIMCGKCDELCEQSGINHLELWKTLRAEAEARGIKPSYAK